MQALFYLIGYLGYIFICFRVTHKNYQSPHKQPWLVPSNEVKLRQAQLRCGDEAARPKGNEK
jgi:hypothetical protein